MQRFYRPGALLLLLALFFVPSQTQAGGVVGNGTPGSCTNTAILNAMVGGGTITFNCGANPVTIPITETLFYDGGAIKSNLEIDGGNKVTLQGTPGVRVIRFRTWGFDAARTLTLRNLTITGASIAGTQEDSNGAAIYVRDQSANFGVDIPTLILENVTLTNNTSTLSAVPPLPRYPYDYGGAAIYALGSDLRINNSRFENNTVNGGTGAAIHGLGSDIRISNSTFLGNQATAIAGNTAETGYAGALYVDNSLNRAGNGIFITGSVFQGNSAVNQGGAAYVNLYPNRNPAFNITGTRFINNSISGGSIGFGGAISAGGTGGSIPINISRSSFVGNTANAGSGGGFGGALGFAQPASVMVSNTTFANNRALLGCNPPEACGRGRGGAISIGNNSPSLTITNVTFSGNNAGWRGGALNSSANTVISNTIFVNNTADSDPSWAQCTSTYTNGGGNLQFPAGSQACTNGAINANPNLAALTDNSYFPLQSGSPAIDRGNLSRCMNAPVSWVDQLGAARPQNGMCDIGAVERPASTGPSADTPGVFYPSFGTWLLRNDNSRGNPDVPSFGYGRGGARLTGDWDGDGDDSVGVFYPSTGEWYLRNSNTRGNPDIPVFSYGKGGTPVVGDWNGDGTDTVGVFYPGTGGWYLRNSNVGGNPDVPVFNYGKGGAPVVGDWNGDGIDTVGVFYGSTGRWLLRNSNSPGNPSISLTYGAGGLPVTGDWNTDNTDTLGVFYFSSGAWLLRNENAPGNPNYTFPYGKGGIPIVGDWDGTTGASSALVQEGIYAISILNAETGQHLRVIDDGATLTDLPDEMHIVAEAFGGDTVVFDYQGVSAFTTDNAAPFTLTGDAPAVLSDGEHTLTATLYQGGQIVDTLTITFTVE